MELLKQNHPQERAKKEKKKNTEPPPQYHASKNNIDYVRCSVRPPVSRAHHFFEKMVDAHCVRDEGGFTLRYNGWLLACGSSGKG